MEEVRQRSSSAAAAVEQMHASIIQIASNTATSTDVATDAVGEVERTNGAVLELRQASAEIGRVVDLITSIAEQTNIAELQSSIAATVAQQSSANQEVASTVDVAARRASDITDVIARVVTATDETRARVDDLLSTAGSIAAIATELDETVGRRDSRHGPSRPRRRPVAGSHRKEPQPA